MELRSFAQIKQKLRGQVKVPAMDSEFKIPKWIPPIGCLLDM